MFSKVLLSTTIVMASLIATFAFAGTIEDELLAGAATRLDPKGVEIALRKGGKATQASPHPDAPAVIRTPIQFTLSAVIGSQEPDAPQRAERILRALFKSGAKLTGDKDELFPAIAGGYTQLVTLLFDHGANPYARIYGYTPAELAIKYEQSKLLPLLYARGLPKVDPQTAAQISFVHAASRQQLAAMQVALANGATVDAPDPAGSIAIVQLFSTPLLEPDGYKVVEWLLFEANADANAIEYSDNKSTALHNVIKRNSYQRNNHFTAAAIAEILLRKGANVSAVDSFGRTPLHYAAQSGNLYAMHILISNGAKVMVRDALQKTPLDLAESGEAISLLREAGAHESQ